MVPLWDKQLQLVSILVGTGHGRRRGRLGNPVPRIAMSVDVRGPNEQGSSETHRSKAGTRAAEELGSAIPGASRPERQGSESSGCGLGDLQSCTRAGILPDLHPPALVCLDLQEKA